MSTRWMMSVEVPEGSGIRDLGWAENLKALETVELR